MKTLFSLIFLAFILPNVSLAQRETSDQYFFHWYAHWQTARHDYDVAAFENMLPPDCTFHWTSNLDGPFFFGKNDRATFLADFERYRNMKLKVRSAAAPHPGSEYIFVEQSVDGSIAWLTTYHKTLLEWEEAGQVKVDSMHEANCFTFHKREGQWQPIAIFNNWFKITNGSNWGAITRHVDASPWQGKKFRLSAAVRMGRKGTDGYSLLWARVDKSDDTRGFFDNMTDRPITSTEWQVYTIEGTIDASAEKLAFGGALVAPGKACFDDFKLSVETNAGQWEDIPLPNGGFENPTWENGKPAEWKGNAFRFDNFQVEQMEGGVFEGKGAVLLTGNR